jgi:hypothetical protein
MITFLLVLFIQRDIGKSFEVEDSLLRKLQGSLPQDGSGYFNSDSRGTGTLEGADEWYNWIGDILNTIYLDAACGEKLLTLRFYSEILFFQLFCSTSVRPVVLHRIIRSV